MRHLSKIFVLAAWLAMTANSFAASIIPSIPYNLTNGTLADATQVMGNFNTIVTDVNANGAKSGANTDITSLTGLTTALAPTYGGTVIYTGGTSAGSANVQTLAAVVPAAFALTIGNMVTGVAGFTNTAAMTLNVNGTGAKAVKKNSTSGLVDVAAYDMVATNPYLFYYDGTQYELMNPTTGTAGSLSAQFDSSFGAAQGDILFRSATSWTVLTPGTSGQVLQTAGAAANPLWINFPAMHAQSFTSTAAFTSTFTTPSTTTAGTVFKFTLTGGGGGGGTPAGPTGGGGAGGTCAILVSSLSASTGYNLTIGGGGVAGANGTLTSAALTGSPVANPGNTGGAGIGGVGGTTGGTCTIALTGGDGGPSQAAATVGGNGGSSFWGGGGSGGTVNGTGAVGKAPGSGGGGGQGAGVGNTGANGIITVEWVL